MGGVAPGNLNTARADLEKQLNTAIQDPRFEIQYYKRTQTNPLMGIDMDKARADYVSSTLAAYDRQTQMNAYQLLQDGNVDRVYGYYGVGSGIPEWNDQYNDFTVKTVAEIQDKIKRVNTNNPNAPTVLDALYGELDNTNKMLAQKKYYSDWWSRPEASAEYLGYQEGIRNAENRARLAAEQETRNQLQRDRLGPRDVLNVGREPGDNQTVIAVRRTSEETKPVTQGGKAR
jgi:hypothetical protein